jgi:hypothetical protein
MPARDRLPNRRPTETIALIGRVRDIASRSDIFPDGRAGEVFLGADRADSPLDVLASDAALLTSLALQHGAGFRRSAAAGFRRSPMR